MSPGKPHPKSPSAADTRSDHGNFEVDLREALASTEVGELSFQQFLEVLKRQREQTRPH